MGEDLIGEEAVEGSKAPEEKLVSHKVGRFKSKLLQNTIARDSKGRENRDVDWGGE